MNNLHSAIRIEAGGCQLNVFQVGNSPRLKALDSRQRSLRWIHTHFAYEVFFVIAGTLELITEHDTGEYRDAVVIIPPKLKHCSAAGEGESYCLLFSFAENSAVADTLSQRMKNGVLSLPMADDVSFYIRKLAEKMLKGGEEADAGHLAALIFSSVFSGLRQGDGYTGAGKLSASRHINTIEEYINTHMRKKITLADVAEAVYLSTKQVSRIIAKEYGCSFSQLLMEKRLAYAVVMLQNTDMPVSQIAAQIFENTSTYFYAVFKRKYGMSPLQYRKEQRSMDHG